MMAFSTFGLFIVLCAVITLALVWVILRPWLHRTKQAVDNRLVDINIEVFCKRLRELEDDKRAGDLTDHQFDAQKTELERQLLDAQTPADTEGIGTRHAKLAMLIIAPVLVGTGYAVIEDRSEVYELWRAQDQVGAVADDLLTGKINEPPDWAMADIGALFSAMQTNVHHNAHDSARWMRLSNIFLSFEATESGLEALSRAYRLSPNNEEIAMSYAQMSFFVAGGVIDDQTRRVLNDILRKNPEQKEAQMLMIMGEARAGNHQDALQWLNAMQAMLDKNPEANADELADLRAMRDNLSAEAVKAKRDIEVTVSISPSVLPLVESGDVLFVAIRAAEGGAPYAAKRIEARNLTQGKITVKLGNDDAMMPTRTLQKARNEKATLVVSAHISKSGNARAQAGDLIAPPVLLEDKASIAISIDERRS